MVHSGFGKMVALDGGRYQGGLDKRQAEQDLAEGGGCKTAGHVQTPAGGKLQGIRHKGIMEERSTCSGRSCTLCLFAGECSTLDTKTHGCSGQCRSVDHHGNVAAPWYTVGAQHGTAEGHSTHKEGLVD